MSNRIFPALLLGVLIAFLVIIIAGPLVTLLLRSLHDRAGNWIGMANFGTFWASQALARAAWHSFTVAALTTLLTLALAFPYAFGLTRSRLRLTGMFRNVAQIPLLAPSLLPALSLVLLFGNQGVVRQVLMGHSIYGPIGIVLAEIFYTFPHALLILTTALAVADARLYEAAQSLGAGPFRRFMTVTLPGARYGLVMAAFVVFTLVITDFGIPAVLGGAYDVLATEVFEQVVGLQDFGMGAVVGLVLLLPALLAFAAENWGARRQNALLSVRATPYRPQPSTVADFCLFAFCSLVAVFLLAVMLMAVYASLVTFWPYNLHLSLRNYDFDRFDEQGWGSFTTSLQMAGWSALLATLVTFSGAFLVEKFPAPGALKAVIRFLAILPLGIPGMVLGLAYILFFTLPANPLGGLYGTLALLILSNCAHFYSVGHLTAVTALKQLDSEFEAVSISLKVPLWRSFWQVTVPLCLPAILDIASYMFVNAMTTVSAMVFLTTPDHKPASVAALNMDESGAVAAASAMATLIACSSALARLAHNLVTSRLLRRTQSWRAG